MMPRLSFLLICFTLVACQGPLGNVEKLSDQDLEVSAGAADAVAEGGAPAMRDEERAVAEDVAEDVQTQERNGLFGFLRRAAEAEPAVATDDTGAEVELAAAAPDASPQATAQDADQPETAATPEPEKRRGLLGGLFGGNRDDTPAPTETAEAATPEATEEVAAPESQKAGFSLFGLGNNRDRRSPPSGPETDIGPGSVMAFGKVGRLCDVSPREVGREVAQYPEKRAKYALIDSAPDASTARSFYISGFDDGCLRQITGALVLFGDVEMHEQIRFGAAAGEQPESLVDKAYNKVKRLICRVGRNKPCGNRMRSLQRDTVFVTVYETFGGSGRWADMLLHDGKVEAIALHHN